MKTHTMRLYENGFIKTGHFPYRNFANKSLRLSKKSFGSSR